MVALATDSISLDVMAAGWKPTTQNVPSDFSRPNVEAPAYPFPPFRGLAHLSSRGLMTQLGRPL